MLEGSSSEPHAVLYYLMMQVTANADDGSQTPTLSRFLGLLLAKSLQIASEPAIG
jgi:hypothetical protein